MSSSLHGENGLDPETAFHLMQTYVIPVLVWHGNCLTETEIHGHARKFQQAIPEVNTVSASQYC